VREYERNLIKKHEHTRKDKEDDRTRHVTECNANAEPVFLTYRARPAIDAIVDRVRRTPPASDFTSDDALSHTVWVVSDRADVDALVKLFMDVPCLYVADGHHRTAAAVRHGQKVRAAAKSPSPTRRTSPSWRSSSARPAPDPRLQPGREGPERSRSDAFVSAVRERFDVSPADDARPPRPRTFGMFLGGKWHRLEAKPGTYPSSDPVRGLDVSILQENLLAPVLGIADPRTDKRIDFVGGSVEWASWRSAARGKRGRVLAVSTSLDQLMAVADAGMVMLRSPPGSSRS